MVTGEEIGKKIFLSIPSPFSLTSSLHLPGPPPLDLEFSTANDEVNFCFDWLLRLV